jgi:hypothetical protein
MDSREAYSACPFCLKLADRGLLLAGGGGGDAAS